MSSNKFHVLFDIWVDSGYNHWLRPSFDRLDDSKGYSFDNFNKWMTWKENKEKSESQMRSGEKGTKRIPHRPVIGIHKETGKVVSFVSVKAAGRGVNVNHSGISKSCRGLAFSAGGYVWEYVD